MGISFSYYQRKVIFVLKREIVLILVIRTSGQKIDYGFSCFPVFILPFVLFFAILINNGIYFSDVSIKLCLEVACCRLDITGMLSVF